MDKKYFRNLLGDRDKLILLEIGAGDFIDTSEFVSEFADTNFELYTFEPDDRNLSKFEERINDERVHLFKEVVGDTDGTVEFYTSTKNPYTGQEFIYSSSLRRPGKDLFEIWPVFIDEETSFKKTHVQSVSLDTFARNKGLKKIDLIWLDCQGCEDIFINGGHWALNNLTDYLYTEYSNMEIYKGEPSLTKILSMIPNFEIVHDFGTDVLLKNKRFEDDRWRK